MPEQAAQQLYTLKDFRSHFSNSVKKAVLFNLFVYFVSSYPWNNI